MNSWARLLGHSPSSSAVESITTFRYSSQTAPTAATQNLTYELTGLVASNVGSLFRLRISLQPVNLRGEGGHRSWR